MKMRMITAPTKLLPIIGVAFIAAAASGCSSTPSRADQEFSDACASVPANDKGETVVVMRDTSSSSKIAGVAPVGVEALGDGVAVVGPAIVTSQASGTAYATSNTNVEMRPCPTSAPN